jgi:hypothetical protein
VGGREPLGQYGEQVSPFVNDSLRSRTIERTANRPKPTRRLTAPALITTSARKSPTLKMTNRSRRRWRR